MVDPITAVNDTGPGISRATILHEGGEGLRGGVVSPRIFLEGRFFFVSCGFSFVLFLGGWMMIWGGGDLVLCFFLLSIASMMMTGAISLNNQQPTRLGQNVLDFQLFPSWRFLLRPAGGDPGRGSD